MATTTRTPDAMNRITLPPAFAGSTVIIEEISATEIRIRKAVVVPADEIVFAEEAGWRSLSAQDRDLLVSLLDNPPEPSATLVKAVAANTARRG